MKILNIASILPVPGIFKDNDVIFKLFKTLQKRHHVDIDFVRPSAYANQLLASIKPKWKAYYDIIKIKKYHYKGFDVEVYPFLDLKASPIVLAKLAHSIVWMNKAKLHKRFIENKYDILHAHWLLPDGLMAYRLYQKYGVPYVLTMRKEYHFLENQQTRILAKKIIANASAVTTLNGRMYTLLKDKYSFNTSLYLIPHGVEDYFFQPPEFTENVKDVKLITISRLLDWKNIDKLIRAIAKLPNKKRIDYTIIGEGPEKKALQSLAKKLDMEDSIHFKKTVSHEQLPEVLQEQDIFVLTSFPETFGRVYFEAMASGVPILCAQNSGVHAYIENNNAGMAANPFNVEDICEKLKKLVLNPNLRETIGEKGQNLVKKYKWGKVADAYHQLYLDAIKQAKS